MIPLQEVRDERDNIKSQIVDLELDIKDRRAQVKALKDSLNNESFVQTVAGVHGACCALVRCSLTDPDYRCKRVEEWKEITERLIYLFSSPGTTKVVKREEKGRSKRKLQFDDDAPVV